MRQYREGEQRMLLRAVCNCCGKELKTENGYLKEECFHAEHSYGYFSEKDGVRHRFDLCESCYEKWIRSFAVPVEEEEVREFL